MRAVIYSHIGTSAYLPQTLAIARITNPEAIRVLVGDDTNKAIATDCGWRHVHHESLSSPAIDRFRKAFKLLASADYWKIPNIYIVTRFVFERYHYSAQVARSLGLHHFWMFDSDEMILEPLDGFETELLGRGIAGTRMSANTSFRGLVTVDLADELLEHSTALFCDEARLQSGWTKIDAERKNMPAFTEMLAGALFEIAPDKCAHLSDAVAGWHFDDCITHEHGFEMTTLGAIAKIPVKHVRFDGRYFTGMRSKEQVKFATINGSGLPRQIFPWFLDCIEARSHQRGRPSDIRAYEPSLMREFGYLVKSKAKALMSR